MKRTNRLRALMLTLCLLAAALLPMNGMQGFAMPVAQAEENLQLLRISLLAQPDSLVEPGEVTLILGIENISEVTAENVYLSSSDGLLSEPIGQIGAGQTISLNRPHTVSQAELDAGAITYIISHDDPGEIGHKVNYTVQTPIVQSELNPEVEFTRQFSSRYVAPGDTVTIVYNIFNSGNVALNSLRVQDSLGDYTGGIDHLDVGENRTLISRVTLDEADSSIATLSYDVEAMDRESFSISLDEAPIRIAYAQIDASISVSYSPFSTDTAEVVLLMSNLGNVDYTNIRITDDIYGGIVADNVVLPSGSADPISISAAYPVRNDEGFRWRITGNSESGEKIDMITETAYLVPREAAYPTEVTLQVQVLTPDIRMAGNVPVRIRIENIGDADVSDIDLNETRLGTVHNFAVLPAGGHIERDFSLPVRESGEFNFIIRYTSIYGEDRGVIAAPAKVEISSDGVLPEGMEESAAGFSGDSFKIGGSSTFAVLLIVGSVLLLALIITLLVLSHKAKMEKKLRMAAERHRKKSDPPARAANPQRKNKK